MILLYLMWGVIDDNYGHERLVFSHERLHSYRNVRIKACAFLFFH